MRKLLNGYATPFTTGLFIVSLISGIFLFFHVGNSYFHGMHEWLSMVLILPFVLHLWKNWRPFSSYFRHAPMILALGLCLVGALAFVVPTSSTTSARGGNPAFAVLGMVTQAPLTNVAPLLGYTPEDLAATLREKGYAVESTDTSISDLLKSAGKSDMDAASLITSLRQ